MTHMSQKRFLFKCRTHKAVEYITFMMAINFGQWPSATGFLFSCISSGRSFSCCVSASLACTLYRPSPLCLSHLFRSATNRACQMAEKCPLTKRNAYLFIPLPLYGPLCGLSMIELLFYSADVLLIHMHWNDNVCYDQYVFILKILCLKLLWITLWWTI